MLTILVKDKTIILKSLEKDNAPILFSAINNNREYLRKWLPWVDSTQSVEDSLSFIQFAEQQNKENNALILGIWDSNDLIGTISLVAINKENHSAEIGYWLIENMQGKGIITACCRELINYSFEKLFIQTIFIRSVTENLKSLNVIKRLGFEKQIIEEMQWVNGKELMTPVTKGTISKQEWKNQEICGSSSSQTLFYKNTLHSLWKKPSSSHSTHHLSSTFNNTASSLNDSVTSMSSLQFK